MDNSFFAYLQQLELMAFFSAYLLVYAVFSILAGNQEGKNLIKNRVLPLLPFAYALTGTLFLGLQIRNLYPDYSLQNISLSIQQPWLTGWALLSIIFWIPAFARKPALSLIHSLVFFFLLVKDLFQLTFNSSADKNVLRNDMRVFTDSILLNLGSLIVIFLISLLIVQFRTRKFSPLL